MTFCCHCDSKYSRNSSTFWCTWIYCLPLLVVLLGCGENAPPTVVLKGSIKTAGGEACGGAFLVFHPQEPERLNDSKPFAIADDAGNFTVTTFSEGDGALPGDYAVTVVWPGKSKAAKLSLSSESSGVGGGEDQLKGAYGDPKTTDLKVTVTNEPNLSLDLEVKEP